MSLLSHSLFSSLRTRERRDKSGFLFSPFFAMSSCKSRRRHSNIKSADLKLGFSLPCPRLRFFPSEEKEKRDREKAVLSENCSLNEGGDACYALLSSSLSLTHYFLVILFQRKKEKGLFAAAE